MKISMPEKLKQHVACDSYGLPAEYIRELIRAGLESGDAVKVDTNYWHNKRHQLIAKTRRS